jgi:Flagellar biosynthesis protein, FliO
MKLIQLNLSTPDDHEEAPEAGKPEAAVSDQPRKPQTFLTALIACAEEQHREDTEPELDLLAAALEELAAQALAEAEPVTVTMQDSAAESLSEPQPAVVAMQDAASDLPVEAEPAAATMEVSAVDEPAVFKPITLRWEELTIAGPGKVMPTAKWQEVVAEEPAIAVEPLSPVAETLSIVEVPLTIVEEPLPGESLASEEPVAVKPAAMEEARPAAPAAVFVPPPMPRPNAFMRAMSWINRRTLSNTRQLRVAETVSLGEKRFVAVVHVEGRKFLIGGGASAVSLLTQLGEESGVASLSPVNLAESLQ